MATPVRETDHAVLVQSRPGLAPSRVDDTDDAALEAVAAKRWRMALMLTGAMLVVYFGFILLIAFAKGFLSERITAGLTVGHGPRSARDPRNVGVDVDVRPLGEPCLRARGRPAEEVGPMLVRRIHRCRFHSRRAQHPSRSCSSSCSSRITLGITCWAARRTNTTEQFYAAGRSDHRLAERPRARRRLHERGELPRHRRPGRDLRLRRPDLLGRLARRLAGRARSSSPSRCATSASTRSPTSSRIRLRQTPVRIAAAIGGARGRHRSI